MVVLFVVCGGVGGGGVDSIIRESGSLGLVTLYRVFRGTWHTHVNSLPQASETPLTVPLSLDILDSWKNNETGSLI